MIRVLIIDDSPVKIERIKKVLVERCAIAVSNIDAANSVSSGKKALKGNFYDLVILDLLLPQFDNDQAVEDGGLSYLKSLNSASDVTLPLQIICLTEYANILDDKREEYDNLMVSAIVKSDADSQWIDQLAEKVNYSQKLRTHIENEINNRIKFDIGVICAIQEEFDMLMEAFGKEKWRDYPVECSSYRFKVVCVSTETMQTVKVIASCACEPGGIATASIASMMYGEFHIDYLFMTGITGGIKKGEDIRLGDIMVAKSVQEYAVGKIAEREGEVIHLKENKLSLANAELLNKMSDFISGREVMSRVNKKIKSAFLKVEDREQYRVHIAPTASGPFVMTSTKMVEELKLGERKLSAIDMEGYALYYTAHAYNKPALWIKGVSDMADSNKGDAYHKTAAFGSAYLLKLFIKEMLFG